MTALVLTRQQAAVLGYFAQGRSQEETARAMHVETSTVRTHARAAYRRLGARDEAHAVALALSVGLIPPVRLGVAS